MRKSTKAVALLLSTMMVLSGCGSSTTTETTTEATTAATTATATAQTEAEATEAEATEAAQTGEQTQFILSTFGLSEDVSEDEVYKPFEDEFNCEIVTEVGNTSERYTKFSSDPNSTIDVIELSQAMTAMGVAAGLFEDIDLSKLDNAEDLVDSVKTFAEAGNGIVYTMNNIGIIYNPELVESEITSYNDLWKPEFEGSIAIPDIASTFGPSMVYLASDYAGVDVTTDDGEAAFKALAELKPNIVKSYSKSSDLINMFTSGEITAAIVGNFAIPTIVAANPQVVFIAPEGSYANFNIISINKNSPNKELAYEYLDYRISQELQTVTGLALNEGPTNKNVEFTEEQAATMTYGDVAMSAKFVDYGFVNPILDSWIDQWNRTINN